MKRMQPMTPEQIDRLRQAAVETGAREAALIAIMTRHFIRASEVAGTDRDGNPTGLKTVDINLKDGTIRINRLKGSVSTTESFLPGERELLAGWLEQKPESAWLFPGRTPERPMTRRQVLNIFHDLAVKAGLPMASAAPHSSRHTIGQMMAEAGCQAKEIQQAAGHKSLNSTGQYYEFRQSHIDAAKARALGRRVATS